MRKRKDRLEERQEAAQAMQAQWQSLSPQEQLAALDRRLGKGKGAQKQRARLARQISAGTSS